MISQDNISQILESGGKVLDNDGGKIGSVGQVYVDDHTGNPSWVTINTGLFGSNESFAPLEGAALEGNDVRVGYSKNKIKDAPNVAPDGHLSEQEEAELYRYYGISTNGYATGEDTTGTTGDSDAHRTTGADDSDRASVGHDTSGPTTDDAMTRSEEQLHVGTERREAGRARLRKFVVTENVTKTVPVQREEVRIEREPITDANRGEAFDGPAISEEEHEVTLHEERPVIEKEAVPVERVRLDKETVTEQQTVNEEVRKEQIDTDGVDSDRR
ncbi:YsnF/AvaK domain-containing protein [uncultured Arthrobacter sp.]|uniref:YsnF/AvaK domain-containing protein n=1 Tax=uncultured Arthrobacter sp. TaxID=114050 RepID=UPI002618C881|nr:YsnF/AvaK domain-containing protein [uncultured Arthrobacter sp.]